MNSTYLTATDDFHSQLGGPFEEQISGPHNSEYSTQGDNVSNLNQQLAEMTALVSKCANK